MATIRLALSRAQSAEIIPLLKLLRRLATPQAREALQQAALLEDTVTKQLAMQLLSNWPSSLGKEPNGNAQSTNVIVDARFDDKE